jgi:hypothetical protein
MMLAWVALVACSDKRSDPLPPPTAPIAPAVVPTAPVESDTRPAPPSAPADLAALALGPPVEGPPPVPRMAFRRNYHTWLSDLDGANARELDSTYESSISSDGRFLLLVDRGAETATFTLMDLETQARVPVVGEPTSDALARFLAGDEWLLFGNERIKRDGTARQRTHGGCLPGHDGTYLLCYSYDGLAETGLDGAPRRVVPLAELIGFQPPQFSATGLSVSHDGRLVAVGAELIDRDLEQGKSAIFVYDRIERRATRITGEDFYARFPQFVRDGTIVFDGFVLDARSIRTFNEDEEVPWAVYRCNADGSNRRTIAENAREPSVAGP